MLTNVIIISLVALTVHFLLRRDFDKGLAAAVFFLILLPKEVQIEMPGALPELTGHRVVLLVLLANMLPRLQRISLLPVSRPLLLLCLVAVCRLFSTVTAIDSAASFKVVFGFLIETVLYFVLIAGGLNERRTIKFVAWSSLLALVLVAGIGTIEKYTGRNLAAMIVPGMNASPNTVTATFRHRILFGYAMAMGFPLALALGGTLERGWKRWLPKIGIVLLPAACYFSNSRGPWMGCGLAGLVMGTLGGRPMRRKLMLLGAAAAVVMAFRPGTYDTISSLWHQSFNDNTIKGRSADYRLVLWRVAYGELSKSFGHTLLGYGGHSTEMLDVSKYFDQGHGGLAGELGYTSWDSQFASNFMQYGFLGFGLETILYLSVLGMLVRTWRHSNEEDREFIAVCVATTLVFFWAMATVAIFNPQLEYLFWAMVAIAGRFYSVTPVADLGPELNEDVRMEAPPHIQARSEIGI